MNKKLISRKALIYSDRRENSNKYYIVEMNEVNNVYEVTAKYGRLGKRPAVTMKGFTNEHSARTFYAKKVSEKIKKGYEEVDLEDIMFNEGEFFN